ncbi:hypothetical protein SARC_08302, partial [Sphaeroforma arctica JP610]
MQVLLTLPLYLTSHGPESFRTIPQLTLLSVGEYSNPRANNQDRGRYNTSRFDSKNRGNGQAPRLRDRNDRRGQRNRNTYPAPHPLATASVVPDQETMSEAMTSNTKNSRQDRSQSRDRRPSRSRTSLSNPRTPGKDEN